MNTLKKNMAYKVFIDVNIFLDLFDISRIGHLDAKKLFGAIEEGNAKGYISESIVNTTSYLVRKLMDKKIFKQMVIDLMELITILPCSNTIIKQAYRNAKNDLEDAVLYELALINGLEYFITSNIKDLKKLEQKSLSVMTTHDFLLHLNN